MAQGVRRSPVRTEQSPLQSLVEAMLGTALGLAVSLLAQVWIFAWVGITVSLGDNLVIALAFTGVSVVRTYLVRRLFEALARPGPAQ